MVVTRSDLEAILGDITAMADLDLKCLPLGASLFILQAKVQSLIDRIEPPDAETARLREWVKSARAVLHSCYSIDKATWKKADGSPVWLRILDQDAVMRVLDS